LQMVHLWTYPPVMSQKPSTSGTTTCANDWHRAEIVCALRLRGWSLRRLSAEQGYKPGVLKGALDRPWPKGQQIIAEALGVDPASIWPSRYSTASGQSGLGVRLKTAIAQLGMTRIEFADRTAIPIRTLASYIAGRRKPGADALASIAAQGVNLNWLLTGAGPMWQDEGRK